MLTASSIFWCTARCTTCATSSSLKATPLQSLLRYLLTNAGEKVLIPDDALLSMYLSGVFYLDGPSIADALYLTLIQNDVYTWIGRFIPADYGSLNKSLEDFLADDKIADFGGDLGDCIRSNAKGSLSAVTIHIQIVADNCIERIDKSFNFSTIAPGKAERAVAERGGGGGAVAKESAEADPGVEQARR